MDKLTTDEIALLLSLLDDEQLFIVSLVIDTHTE